MKRKLIKQGMGGVTMSLPIDWVRDRRLQPGDEVDVQVQSGNLVIGGVGSIERKKTLTIQINEAKIIRTLVSSYYKQGYKELELLFVRPQPMKVMQQIVESFLGFELVYQDKSRCVIQDVMQNKKIDVQSSITKLMQSINLLYDFVIEHAEAGKNTADIASMRKNIFSLRDFILRNLQLYGSKESYDVYVLVVLLEKFAADYYFISTIKKDFNKQCLQELQNVQEQFRLLQKALATNDLKLATNLFNSLRISTRSNQTADQLEDLLLTVRPSSVVVVIHKLLYCLFSMSSRVLLLISSR